MFNLSDEQIAGLQKAINSDDAVTVLTCLMLLFPTKRSGEFVSALARCAKQDPAHAEILFGIAIVLYDKFFPDEHRGGLSALCGLAQSLEDRGDEQDIHKMIDATYPLVIRAARGIGRLDTDEGNGKRASLKLLKNICTDFECDS